MRAGASVDFDLADESAALRVESAGGERERALWLSVLERAVKDARGETEVHSGSKERIAACVYKIRREALHWLHSNKRTIGSLRWIIDVTGLRTTPEAIRRAV
jgi:hypothetical protein